MNSKHIIPLFGADISGEYNRQLRAKRTKAFMARCCVIAAMILLITAVAGMIATVHAPLFSAIVTLILIAGFFGLRYLTTRH